MDIATSQEFLKEKANNSFGFGSHMQPQMKTPNIKTLRES
jgi:hypothetical protein